MSITITNILSNLNTYLGDSSTDRISDAERYQAITEATSWLQEELGNEHMVDTYELNYLDGINYYKVTAGLGDLLVGGELRRGEGENYSSFTRKSPREISNEIATNTKDPSWAIERRDGDSYLVINHDSKNMRVLLDDFSSVSSWTADATGSDALNITLDTNEFKEDTSSLNFDIDVSQSVANYATVYRNDFELDLSSLEDLGTFVLDIYIPDALYTSSVGFYISSNIGGTPSTITDYWSGLTTTDIDGNDFVSGWNKVKLDWSNTTITGTPDSNAIAYVGIRLNYTASQADDTDCRLDNFFIAKPEVLTFHYVSWNVGTNTGGTDISAFTAATDVPFFSGRYDQYRYVIAHKAASILYYSALRLVEQGSVEESEALKALKRYRSNFESNKTREEKSFKVYGVNLRNNRRRNRR